MSDKPRRGRRRWLVAAGLVVYVVLLALSHARINARWPADQAVPEDVQVFDTRPEDDVSYPIGWREWAPSGDEPGKPPLVLIHGSPGGLGNFNALAPRIAGSGRRVISVDLPGFGVASRVTGLYSGKTSLSLEGHAGAVLALLDHLDIERAHVAGWSQGGGVCLFAADLAARAGSPDRIASVTLIASVGVQEAEGSGSYWFEHAKYAVGYAGLVLLPEAVPHFGLLGPWRFRHAFIRNFSDSDQRPIRRIMVERDTPILILHGRDDFLIADWAAEMNHAAAPNSHLIMLDARHFLPFKQADETADYLAKHMARHDSPGVEPVRRYDDLSPVPDPTMLERVVRTLERAAIAGPWWIEVFALALLAALSRNGSLTLGGLLVGLGALDFGVVTAGLWLGRGWIGMREASASRVLGVVFGLPLALLLVTGFGFVGVKLARDAAGDLAALGAIVAIPVVLEIAPALWTRRDRQRLRARAARMFHYEFWPSSVFYLPLIPYLAWLSVRHRGMTVFACANPGVPHGGGFVGEEKNIIMGGFGDHPALLRHTLIKPGEPDQRARALADSLDHLGGYPLILKPNEGQRGFGVKLVKDQKQAREYLARWNAPVIAQQYHPGPSEVGVMWVRDLDADTGRIFSITRKDFPVIEGDGSSTLEDFIWRHKRYRLQADVFLERLGQRAREVPPSGERVRIGESGNHCQGTLFRDGADLLTPELERAINDLARSFADDAIDFGRFDVRYESQDDLRAGRDLAVVEFNGSSSESTNLYDPDHNLSWAYSILFRQWRTLYQLGAWRRDQGARRPGLFRLLVWARRHYKLRQGPEIAD